MSWGTASTFSEGWPLNPLKRLSNSRRANASRPQISGGWAGVVGVVPASGCSTQLSTLETALATAVTGLGAAVVTAVRAAIIGDTSVGDAAASVRASANTA